MKTLTLVTAVLCTTLILASCGRDSAGSYSMKDESATSAADKTAPVMEPALEESAPGGSANGAVLPLNAPSRKIVKTADLRCRVTDVFATTTHIERLTAASGGQISDSRLDNVTEETRSLPYKPDSLRQVESYTTTAHLTLRIPVVMLDTVLADIAGRSAFVNSRNLHLDDVTLRYLSNKLKNEAMAANDAASRARVLARRSKDAVYSGEYTDQRDETRIDRRIENMQLTDQVAYATLSIDLYQPQRISQMIVPNSDYLMKPTMGQQAALALNSGWLLLRSVLIGLLHVWPLMLIVVIAMIAFRKRLWKRRVVVVSR